MAVQYHNHCYDNNCKLSKSGSYATDVYNVSNVSNYVCIYMYVYSITLNTTIYTLI